MRTLLLPALLLAVGCAGGDAVRTTGPDARPSPRALRALADSLAADASTAAREGVVRRAFARSGLTPLSDFGRPPAPAPRFEAPLGRPHVAAFVPGRDPRVRSELVVVGTALEGGSAPALVEAARVLAERGLWTQTPGRTVEAVVWSAAPSDRLGLLRALEAPLWDRSQIRAVVVVSDEDVGEVEGLEVVRIAPEGDRAALALALVERAAQLARYVPPPPDTTTAAR